MQEGWLKEIPVDPENFRFDVEIYAPNPDDYVIAPERVRITSYNVCYTMLLRIECG